MNLYLRLFYVLFAAFLRKRIKSPLEETDLQFRVLPTDLDINGHMNNGRYLTLMDIGRMDYAIRLGLASYMVKNKYYPLTAGVTIRYRLPLRLFQKFRITTRTVCWGRKWIYMEQKFILASGRRTGAVAATALIRIGYSDIRNHRTVTTEDILKALNLSLQSPVAPAHMDRWAGSDDAGAEDIRRAA